MVTWTIFVPVEIKKKKKVDSVRIYLRVNSEGCGYELGIEIEEGERQLRGNLRI